MDERPDIEPWRWLLRVKKWFEVEQHRRDLKCWHKGHRGFSGARCRRCGRIIFD